jgi:hypothetical protein
MGRDEDPEARREWVAQYPKGMDMSDVRVDPRPFLSRLPRPASRQPPAPSAQALKHPSIPASHPPASHPPARKPSRSRVPGDLETFA